MYTLDTNVIIYHLEGEASVVDFLIAAAREYAVFSVSVVAETELFSKKDLTTHEHTRINEFLTQCDMIPVTSPIARAAGDLRRNYNLKLADSLIAATALQRNATLVTRNVRDFKRVPGLRIEAM